MPVKYLLRRKRLPGAAVGGFFGGRLFGAAPSRPQPPPLPSLEETLFQQGMRPEDIGAVPLPAPGGTGGATDWAPSPMEPFLVSIQRAQLALPNLQKEFDAYLDTELRRQGYTLTADGWVAPAASLTQADVDEGVRRIQERFVQEYVRPLEIAVDAGATRSQELLDSIRSRYSLAQAIAAGEQGQPPGDQAATPHGITFGSLEDVPTSTLLAGASRSGVISLPQPPKKTFIGKLLGGIADAGEFIWKNVDPASRKSLAVLAKTAETVGGPVLEAVETVAGPLSWPYETIGVPAAARAIDLWEMLPKPVRLLIATGGPTPLAAGAAIIEGLDAAGASDETQADVLGLLLDPLNLVPFVGFTKASTVSNAVRSGLRSRPVLAALVKARPFGEKVIATFPPGLVRVAGALPKDAVAAGRRARPPLEVAALKLQRELVPEVMAASIREKDIGPLQEIAKVLRGLIRVESGEEIKKPVKILRAYYRGDVTPEFVSHLLGGITESELATRLAAEGGDPEAARLQEIVDFARAVLGRGRRERVAAVEERIRIFEQLAKAFEEGVFKDQGVVLPYYRTQLALAYDNFLQKQLALAKGAKAGLRVPSVAEESAQALLPLALMRSLGEWAGAGPVESVFGTVAAYLAELYKAFPMAVVRRLPDGITEQRGTIRGVVRDSFKIPPVASAADLVRNADKITFTVLFEPTTGATDVLRVPAEELIMRYVPAQTLARRALAREALKDLRSLLAATGLAAEEVAAAGPGRQVSADVEEALYALIKTARDPSFRGAKWVVVKSPQQLQMEANLARDEMMSYFYALPGTVERGRTAAQTRDLNIGRLLLMTLPPPGRGAEAAEAHLAALKTLMRPILERRAALEPALNDPEFDKMLGALRDFEPAKMLRIMLSRSTYSRLTEMADAGISPAGTIGRQLWGMLTGKRVFARPLLGIMHFWGTQRPYWASLVEAYQGGLVTLARAEALREARVIEVAAGTTLPSARDLYRLGTSAGKRELEDMLAQKFDVARLRAQVAAAGELEPLGPASFLRLHDSLPPEMQAELVDIVRREPWFALTYGGGLFQDLPHWFGDISVVWKENLEEFFKMSQVTGTLGVRQALANRMMIVGAARDWVDASIMAKSDNAFEVIGEAARYARAHNKSLREVLALGDTFALAESYSAVEAAAINRTLRALQDLAKPGQTVTTQDLVRVGGKLKIQSLHKWPAEYENDLRAVSDLLSGEGVNDVFKGGVAVARQLALGRLIGDLTVLTLQAPIWMSHIALAGLNPAHKGTGLAKVFNPKIYWDYAREVWDSTSDLGFHALVRQNWDEISYYISLDWKTGMEAYLAGPAPNRLPLEYLPLAGRVMKGALAFNDLNFNRWVFTMKLHAIRENLWWAQVLRKLGVGKEADDVFEASPTLKKIRDLVGHQEFFSGPDEAVHRVVIQHVNNTMGGIPWEAQGIGAMRAAVDQIMLLVPGFFRAQVGMITDIVKDPLSLRGWLGTTGLAREVMLMGAASYGLSSVTGNGHRVNLTDPSRADWMAVQTDEGYVSIFPRPAVIRFASRMVSEAIGALQGKGFDPMYAVESFVGGRFSPPVSAVYRGISDRDFLGRRYTDNMDKWSSILSQTILPIVWDNMIQETKENIRQYGLGPALAQLPRDTMLNVLGKNFVPRNPLEELDRRVQALAGTPGTMVGEKADSWFQLDPHVRDGLMARFPDLKILWDQYLYLRERRFSDKEARINAGYRAFEEEADRIRTEPTDILGRVTSQYDDSRQLFEGVITGDEWRARYQERAQRIAYLWEDTRAAFLREGYNPDAERDERLARAREEMSPEDENLLLREAFAAYQSVQPPTKAMPRWTPGGIVMVDELDWDAFDAERAAALAPYPQSIQEYVREEARTNWRDPGVERYRVATEQRDAVEALPKYVGTTVEESRLIDDARAAMADAIARVRMSLGAPGAVVPLPAGMGDAIRAATISRIIQGTPSAREQYLVKLAYVMAEDQLVAYASLSKEAPEYLLANQNVLYFYPYLLSRIPLEMKGRLDLVLLRQYEWWQRRIISEAQ